MIKEILKITSYLFYIVSLKAELQMRLVNRQYDLAVIGSGPAGQKAAIQGAKLGKRVAIVDRASCVGGICIHHGAIPSKSLREAILYFTGFYHRQTYGARLHKDLTMQELMDRCAQVESNEAANRCRPTGEKSS